MFISEDFCPVPFDQQPINEYHELKKSCFFYWLMLRIKNYLQFLVFFAIIIVVFFISSATLIDYHLFFSPKLFTLDLLLTTGVFLLILIRLYLAWSYVSNRLLSATVFYEESGWYDGQIWFKTTKVLTKDRLIGIYEVLPFLKRLKFALSIFLFFFILESIVYYLI